MDKEVSEIFSALKEITKLKEVMVERLQESKSKSPQTCESIYKINDQIKSLHASIQSQLLKSSELQDKKTLYRKLIEYKNFDAKMSESFQSCLDKESLIASNNLLQKINDHIDHIRAICDEISNTSVESVPLSSVLKIRQNASDNSSLGSLDQFLIICIFITVIFLCLLVLNPNSILNNL